MKRILPFTLLILGSAGCGPSEEEKRKRANSEQFVEEISRTGSAYLDRYMEVHKRFLEVRQEKNKTSLQPGGEKMTALQRDKSDRNTWLVVFRDKMDDGDQFPEKYSSLAYWKNFSAITAAADSMKNSRIELEQEGYLDVDFEREQFQSFTKELENFKYVIILDGKYRAPTIHTDRKTKTTGFIPGTYQGAGFVFRIEDAKYLGQFPVQASNSTTIGYESNTSPLSEIRRDLLLQAEKAAYDTFGKRTGQ